MMRPMRKLETEDILPKHQRALDIRDGETGVIGCHDVKRRGAHAPDCLSTRFNSKRRTPNAQFRKGGTAPNAFAGDAKIKLGYADIFYSTQAAFDRRLGTPGLGHRRAAQSELGFTVVLVHALRHRVADVQFHQTNVRSVDRTIDGQILAEVTGRN